MRLCDRVKLKVMGMRGDWWNRYWKCNENRSMKGGKMGMKELCKGGFDAFKGYFKSKLADVTTEIINHVGIRCRRCMHVCLSNFQVWPQPPHYDLNLNTKLDFQASCHGSSCKMAGMSLP